MITLGEYEDNKYLTEDLCFYMLQFSFTVQLTYLSSHILLRNVSHSVPSETRPNVRPFTTLYVLCWCHRLWAQNHDFSSEGASNFRHNV